MSGPPRQTSGIHLTEYNSPNVTTSQQPDTLSLMLETVYLNGQYLPLSEAKISVLDRGFLFGDGVYEAFPVFNQKPFRLKAHLDRLRNSLSAIQMEEPLTEQQWQAIFERVIKANKLPNQIIYFQVTRGADDTRLHVPTKKLTPTIFVGALAYEPQSTAELRRGFHAITAPEQRWHNCYIKATSLLPNVLAQLQASKKQVKETIFINDKHQVTEASASNVFVVKDDVIMTPAKSETILGGITRDLIVELAQQTGLPLQETVIPESTIDNADEVWITASTKEIMPIIQLNGHPVGSGKAGPYWEKIMSIYQRYKESL